MPKICKNIQGLACRLVKLQMSQQMPRDLPYKFKLELLPWIKGVFLPKLIIKCYYKLITKEFILLILIFIAFVKSVKTHQIMIVEALN